MKITGEDLERSVGGVLSRFGIDKEEAKKIRKQLDSRIKRDEAKDEKLDYNEKYHVHFINRFALLDIAIDDVLMPTLSIIEQSLYRRLYRLSFGYCKTWCQVSYSELRKACNISSDMTVRKGIRGLEDNHCIKVITQSIQRKPPIYRVYLPCEMPQFTAMDIQTSVIFSEEKIEIQSIRDIFNSKLDTSYLNISPLKIRSLEELRQLISRKQNPKISALKNSPLTDKANDNKLLENTKKEEKASINNIINKDYINTLSIDEIVNSFYKGIKQEKVTKEKRERAELNVRKLLEEGFTLDEIQYAVTWTIKNAREEPYDFSIINHTIGQAKAAKLKEEEENVKQAEKDKIRTQEESNEKIRLEKAERIRKYKESLSKKEKEELRKKAENEIRNSKEFNSALITNVLIESKENEIIAEEIGIDIS